MVRKLLKLPIHFIRAFFFFAAVSFAPPLTLSIDTPFSLLNDKTDTNAHKHTISNNFYFSEELSFVNYLWEDTPTAEAGFKKMFQKVEVILLKEEIVFDKNEDDLKVALAPVISCPSPLSQNVDAGNCSAIVNNIDLITNGTEVLQTWSFAGATTGSSPVSGINDASGETFNVGVTTINYYVENSSGENANCSFTVTVTDNENPTIIVAANITTTTSADGTGNCTVSRAITNATYADNCSVTKLTWAMTGVTAGNSPATGINQVGTKIFNIGETTITYIVTDGSGNTLTDSMTVTVTDDENSSISVTANVSTTTSADGTGNCYVAVAIADATYGDNCMGSSLTWVMTGAVTESGSGQIGTYNFPKGTTTITYTVTDGAIPANTNTGTKTVTVTDNENPTTPVLPDLTAECTLTVTAPTTTDNCDGTITGATGVSLTFDTIGTDIIYWTFTDSSGNFIIAQQNITINDTNAPVPNISSLPEVPITGCQISSISELTIPTATDYCDGLIQGTLSADFIFPYSFNGTQTIDWKFIDSTGKVSIQSQDITFTPPPIAGGTLEGTFESTVFSDEIDITSCGVAISIELNLGGEIGTIVQWERYAVNDGFWEVITDADNDDHKYTASFPIGALESTYYRVLVQEGTCAEYSSQFYVRALPPGALPDVQILDDDAYYCLGEEVNLIATSNYLATQEAIPNTSGDFNQGQLNTQDPDGWLVDGLPGGFTAGGSATKPRNWSGKTCNNKANGNIIYCSGDLKYAIAYGDYSDSGYKGLNPTTLETPIMDLSDAESASLDFDQAYYFINNDYAIIEISIDGGVNYSQLMLMHAVGSGVLNWYTAGTAESVVGSDATHYNFSTDNTSIPLTAYLGESNVRIRWSFTGTSSSSAWTMDNIVVNKEVFVETEIEWTDGIGDPDEDPIVEGQTEVEFTFTPDAPGQHQYGGTALINGCRTYDTDGTALIDVYVSYSYAGVNVEYTSQKCGQNTVQLNAYDNTKSANDNATKGAFTIPADCINCDDEGTMDLGKWTVTPDPGNSCGTGTFSSNNPTKYPNPTNDPDALFTGEAGTYTLTWTVNGCGSDITVKTTNCDQIDFDGNNDYVDFETNNFHLDNGAFSIEAWVKPGSIAGTQSIFSKRDANVSGSDGYDLRISNSGEVSFNWNSGTINSSPYKIGADRWYHVAVTRSSTSGEYRLYIDGVLIKLIGGGSPKVNNNKAILGAMDQVGNLDIFGKPTKEPVNYFNGWIDEFRIWNVVLTSDQLHQIMNQKIISSPDVAGNVQGETIPIDINELSWANLLGYYQMESAEVACGYLNSTSSLIKGKLKNITSDETQSAPIPYTSTALGGNWNTMGTWTQPSVWDAPNSLGINGIRIDWNIVQLSNQLPYPITSGTRDITLLGLISDSGKLTIDGNTNMSTGTGTGQGLWITHYLKLNGIIDLEGESQLVQKRYTASQFSESIFDATSSGYIERNQQGQKNSFNYNYWSSPVSPQNGTANNLPYSVGGILKDGTNSATPVPITFGDGAYFADSPNPIGNPIKISNRWLWSYNSTTVGNDDWTNYYHWNNIKSNGLLKTGEGYIMKGTGGTAAITDLQNYVFVGKPHSGTISLNIVKDKSYLIGNPYPSALDADEFIMDNISVANGGRNLNGNIFNGALYFWDHFGLTNNHLLAQYTGGYATYTLIGQAEAIANLSLGINNLSYGTKLPKRYIPVGQGFFVEGALDPKVPETVSVVGGTLVFKNSQRAFEREAPGSSIFMKGAKAKGTTINEAKYVDSRPKIRLQFDSPLGYQRGLLVGVDQRASNNFDIGFDAPLNEDNKEDMFWQLGKGKLVIQGVNNFNLDQELPLGLKIAKAGLATIKIEEIQNIDENTTLNIKDKFTGKTHNISQRPFEIELVPGTYLDRFALIFKYQKLVAEDLGTDILIVEPLIEDNNYHVFINNTIEELQIKNNGTDEIRSVALYNNLGQTMKIWNTELNRRIISLPVKVATGVYVVQINTINGAVNKKIIIE